MEARAFAMKKCITGHVGTPEFKEAMRLLEEGYRHWTLFVHDGASEKAVHFSPTEVIVLNLPSGTPGLDAAGGPWSRLAALRKAAREEGQSSPQDQSSLPGSASYRKAAREYITQELAEIGAWQGAPFELREGPIPQAVAASECALRIGIPSAILLDGFRKDEPGSAAGAAPGDSVFSWDPLARIEVLSRLVGSAFARSVILRELARAWRELGSPAQAARCLRALAQSCREWGAGDIAVDVLETALKTCPPDTAVAEDLLRCYQAAGRQKDAEAVLLETCALLEKLKLHQEAVALYQLLDRPPESLPLRLLGAEALFHAGRLEQAVKELKSAASILESRGDREGAARAYGRILELDPSQSAARERWERLGRSRALRSLGKTAGALVAAGGLIVFFLVWEIAAASAYGKLRESSLPEDAHRSVDLLQEEARRFPASRHAHRIAALEASVYEQAYESDKKALQHALGARAAGDLGTARHLLAELAGRTIIPAFRARAEGALSEISQLQARWDELGRRARDLVERREFEKAFEAYREILQETRRDLFASGYTVPIFVETVPAGADLEVDGKPLGRTPRWILVSADPESSLRISRQGFEALELRDPLGGLLSAGSCRLRKALAAPAIAWAPEAGGTLTDGTDEPQDPALVSGADGVLRALRADGLSTLWEVPLDPRWGVAGPPRGAGPVVLLGTSKGMVMAFSSSTGRPAWVARVAGEGEAVSLGPSILGQVMVVARGSAILLNPLTGLLHRRLALGNAEAAGPVTAAAGRAYVALRGGGLAVCSLRTGKLEGTWPAGDLRAVLSQKDGVVVLTRDGILRSLGPEGGPRRWEVRLGSQYSLACKATESRVCAASPSGSVICLDSGSGTPVWKLSLDGSLQRLSGGSGRGHWVFAHLVRASGMALNALSVEDGALSWETSSEKAEASSVAPARDGLLVSSPTLGVLAVRVPGLRS